LDQESTMNKDRIVGVVKQAEGSLKETIGKTLGDAKLVADGKVQHAEGTAQNALGGLQDALKK
jgi:uncharacterized protein YjbJ (UPF0337 family)